MYSYKDISSVVPYIFKLSFTFIVPSPTLIPPCTTIIRPPVLSKTLAVALIAAGMTQCVEVVEDMAVR